MSEIMAIASGTWRRILRMRVVYFLIICVLILIGNAINYDVLSMGEDRALMIDVSLVLNTVAAVLVAISLSFEIPKELREGVASTLLTKPLGRTQYLIGKLVGTSVTGFVICGLIAVGFFLIYKYSYNDQTVSASMLQGHLLVLLSVVPMCALALLFSTFIPEMVTALVTAGVIWFSFSSQQLSGLKILYGGILPDLNVYNLKAYAVYYTDIHWPYIFMALAWGVVFSIFATSLASLIFSSKDLK